ncbi:50S ribosomal protein L18 [Candidatus Woesearchaeota archaeon]|nr:50S ribosomal protein L18 [Candidatus Woesearchaeota archaeon]
MKGKIYSVTFRRKREGRTHYKKRLKILKSNKHRLVIRKSLKNIQASIIEYNPTGDKVILTVTSTQLRKIGWKAHGGNLQSAYLTGYFLGKKAIEKGIKDAVIDFGFSKSTKGSAIYSALAGAIDAGLKVPFNQDILPTKDRLSGQHIAKYAELLKKDRSKFEIQFSNYLRDGINPEDIVKHFNEIRSKLNG